MSHVVNKKPASHYFTYNACNICGQSNYKGVYKIDKAYFLNHMPEAWSHYELPDLELVKCTNCSHRFISPLPSEQLLDMFYGNYMTTGKEDFYKDHFDTNYEKHYFAQRLSGYIEEIANFCPPKANLLDVGCSTGIFLDIAQKRGFECYGIEINSEAANFAQMEFGLSVYRRKLEELTLPSEGFDIITLWDLIEHLRLPSEFLGEIHRILKKEGILVLETPNINSLLHQTALMIYYATFKNWASPMRIYNIHHLHYFSDATIKSLLKYNGFQVIKVTKDQTNLGQWLGKDRDNIIKDDLLLNLGTRFIFGLAKLLNRQNKIIIFARKKP